MARALWSLPLLFLLFYVLQEGDTVEVRGTEAIRGRLRELNHHVREHRGGAGLREEEILEIQVPITALASVDRWVKVWQG